MNTESDTHPPEEEELPSEEEKKTIEQVAKETASLFKRALKEEEAKSPPHKSRLHKKIKLEE